MKQVNWAWKEGVQFAFAEKFLLENDFFLTYDKNFSEQFGIFLVKPLYGLIDYIARHVKKPLAIFVFTIVAALCAMLVFYNIPALLMLGKLFPSKAVRCLLFIYVEANLFGMGCRAMGRFNNKTLIDLWKKGKLIPIFPGDSRF